MNFDEVAQPGIVVKQPALVVGLQAVMLLAVLAGVVVFGAWDLLWLPLTAYPIVILCNVCRRMYWRGFDPFIWRAAENEQKGRFLFWNILTIFLDWTMNAIPMAATAYIVCHLAEGTPLPPVFVWLAFSLVVYPPRRYTHRDHTFISDIFASSQFYLSIALAVASFFTPVTPFFVATLGFAMTFVMVPMQAWRERNRMKRDYEQFLGERKQGYERRQTWGSSWFPRKGVIFEPQYNKYMGLNVSTFFEFQKSFTILRINWFGFALSLALLVGGIVRCVQLGKPLLILFLPVVVLFGLWYGAIVSAVDRKVGQTADIDPAHGIFSFIAMVGLAVPVLFFGGHDLQPLVAVAALFLGMFFFFSGFMVRGTSEGVFDTLELVLAIGGLAAVCAARLYLNVAWYEALIAVIPFAVLLPYLRAWKPRRDLPEKRDEGSGMRDEKKDEAAAAAKKDRRDRKRERQMAAFRRSKRG